MFRALTPEEQKLVSALAGSNLPIDLAAQVQTMSDGGMGSLRFAGNPDAKFGRVHAEAEATDSDGTPLMISMNLDQYGGLFELDIWRVDFSPLKQLPKPSELHIIPLGGSL